MSDEWVDELHKLRERLRPERPTCGKCGKPGHMFPDGDLFDVNGNAGPVCLPCILNGRKQPKEDE